VVKHNPFVYYNNVRNNSSRCQSNVVPFTQFATDLQSTSTTPSFSWVTPDMCNDTHDCSIATGDQWLSRQLPAILGSPAFTQQNSLLILTWDEDDFGGTNQVAFVVAGSQVKRGYVSTSSYNHYSVLRTLEAAWNLSSLTSNDAGSNPMADLFAASPGTACTSVIASAAPLSPSLAGTQVAFTATAAGCPNPQYQFWTLAPGSTTWTIAQPYSSTATFTWNTNGLAAGTHRYTVWARDASGAGTSSNSLGSFDTYAPATAYPLTTTTCTSVTDSAAPTLTASAGTSVTFTGSASGCPNALYQFWTLAPGSSTWTIAQPYSSSATLSWNTTRLTAGAWRYTVWARDAGSTGISCNNLGCFDTYFPATHYTLTSTPCASVTETTAAAGTTVTFAAIASGCPNPRYQFWLLAPGSTTWTIAQGYSPTATFSWNTTGLAPGAYRYTVWVRDASSAGSGSNNLGDFDAYFPATAYPLS
jgi:hypothetical protein